MKRGVDQYTETTEKSMLRYITFDQGRIIVLKRLREKVDGDHYSQMRQYPECFDRNVDEGLMKMPNLTWNAKIVRVYKIPYLKNIKWTNYK
jgi:hypothetical protein